MPLDKFHDDEDRAQSLRDAEDGREFLAALPQLTTALAADEWYVARADGAAQLEGHIIGHGMIEGVWVPSCYLTLHLAWDADRERLVPVEADATVYPHEMYVSCQYGPSTWGDGALAVWDGVMAEAFEQDVPAS